MNGSAPRSKEEGQKRPDKKPVVPSAVWHGTMKAALEEGRKTASHLGHRIRRAPKAPSASIKSLLSSPTISPLVAGFGRRREKRGRRERRQRPWPNSPRKTRFLPPPHWGSQRRRKTTEAKKRRFRFGVSSTIFPLLPCRFLQASHLDAPRGGGKGKDFSDDDAFPAGLLPPLFSARPLVGRVFPNPALVCARERGGGGESVGRDEEEASLSSFGWMERGIG